LDGEEDKAMRVCLEEWLRSEESFGFGGLVFRWWVERGGGSGGFPCGVGCIGAKFVPVITVVADEVGDFAEGLVRYGVLERHVSGMWGTKQRQQWQRWVEVLM
jgi:hypothetical protein